MRQLTDRQRLRNRILPMILLLTVPLLLTACGTPAVVSVRNITNATAEPQNAVAILPSATQGDMPDMAVPTTAAPSSDVATGSGTDYVLIWVLFGTPTPTQMQPNALTGTPDGTVVSMAATSTIAATPTAAITSVPTATLLATVPPTAMPAAAVGSGSATGNTANGQSIFTGMGGCSTCHDTSTGNTIVGPSLKGVASRAGNRKPGMSASDYLHESIKNPNVFVVPGFPSGVMPQTFNQMLTPQQIDDVVAYLLSLK